jgi:hypothetical protein
MAHHLAVTRVALSGEIETAIAEEIGKRRVSKQHAETHRPVGIATAHLNMVGEDCPIPEAFVNGVLRRFDRYGAKRYGFDLVREGPKMRVKIRFY